MADESLILAIDIGGTKIDVGLVRCDGELIRRRRGPSSPGGTRGEVLTAIDQAIRSLPDEGYDRISAGFPSFGDYEAGILRSELSAFPSMDGFDLKRHLEQSYGAPTRLVPDTTLFAAGIAKFGEGEAHRSFLALALGTGTAIAEVRERVVVAGPVGPSEAAVRFYTDWGWPHGWRHSGLRFVEHYGADAPTMLDRARRDDPAALEAFAAVGRALAETISRLCEETGLRVVVLGGGLCAAYQYFAPATEQALAEQALAKAAITIMRTSLKYPSLLGGAALWCEG